MTLIVVVLFREPLPGYKRDRTQSKSDELAKMSFLSGGVSCSIRVQYKDAQAHPSKRMFYRLTVRTRTHGESIETSNSIFIFFKLFIYIIYTI